MTKFFFTMDNQTNGRDTFYTTDGMLYTDELPKQLTLKNDGKNIFLLHYGPKSNKTHYTSQKPFPFIYVEVHNEHQSLQHLFALIDGDAKKKFLDWFSLHHPVIVLPTWCSP